MDLVENGSDITHLVGNRNLDLGSAHINFGFLDSFEATGRHEVYIAHFLSGNKDVSGTDSRFHNTTGSTEDGAGAGVGPEGAVGFLVGKVENIDTGLLDHAGKFTGSNGAVDIPFTGGLHILVTMGLVLLGGTGHDRYRVDLLGVDPGFGGPVCLDHGTHHLLRALCRREVGDHVVVVLLHVIDPSGATGGDQRNIAALGKAGDELGALFHDRKVGGKVGIKDRLEAQAAKGRIDLLGDDRTGFKPELFTKSDTNGRCNLNYRMDIRITQAIPHLDSIVALVDGANRTVGRTLATLDTGAVSQRDICSGGNAPLLATTQELACPDILHVLADLDAAATANALVGVEGDGRIGIIHRGTAQEVLVGNLADAELGSERLQLTGPAAGALETVIRVVR